MLKNYSNLTELLVSIVQEYPDDIAIKDSSRYFTYLQLYQKANAIAALFMANHILPGDRVVCITKKDACSIVCFWGVLLCGGVPVLLDHEDGIKTNEIKIKGVAPFAVIGDLRNYPTTEVLAHVRKFDPEELMSLREIRLSEIKPDVSRFTSTCYILLTSGTTGIPKAVQISHDNVLHYTFSLYEKIGSPKKVQAAHVSTFGADLGLTNLLMALVSGGMLRVLNKTEATDPDYFKEIVHDDKISLLKISTSHLTSLISDIAGDYSSMIDTILLGGEKLSWEFVEYIFSINICSALYNHYGPTETTIGALAFKIEPTYRSRGRTGSVPIGIPIGENICWLNGGDNNIGELYIAGPGVSLGYLGNEEENNRRFALAEIDGKKIKCYKTGDICKKLDDGNYEFLYRTDRQAKIKGYRIELGEVELTIAGNEFVEHVMVSVSTLLGHSVLDAYIKPVKKGQLDKESLREWLSQRLPGYKIPSNFYFYTQAPYNSNGKVDLHSLQKSFKEDIESSVPGAEAIDASSWKELLHASWKQILNRRTISESDNFFETGGDSLMAIQLIGRLQRYGYKVHINDLNYNPVLRDLLNFNPSRFDANDHVEPRKNLNRLTFSQHKLLKQKKFDPAEYCQTILLESARKINIRDMTLAIECVLKAHSQLRAAFKKKDGSFVVENRRLGGFKLDISVLNDWESLILQIQRGSSNLLGNISIEEGELFKVQIFVDPDGKDYLFLACHHLVVDVISWNIIIDELIDYYDQISKNSSPVIIPENAANEYFNQISNVEPGDSMKADPEFSRSIDRLGYEKNGIAAKSIEVCSIGMPAEISRALLKIDEQNQFLTLGGFLLAAFGNAFIQTLKTPQVTIDLEFHGRPQDDSLPDLSRSVAWWAVTMPVKLEENKIDPQICSELIDEKALTANQLNLYTQRFNDHIDNGSGILFNYLGHFPEYFSNSSIQLKPSSFNAGPTRNKGAQHEYDLCLTIRFIGEVLFTDIQYNTGWYSRSAIKRLAEKFFNNIIEQLKRVGYGFSFPRLAMRNSNMASIGQPLHHFNTTADRNQISGKSILLTGATGFLGLFILRELISNKKATVYCLVRGDGDTDKATLRLREKFNFYFGREELFPEQVIVVEGDLLKKNLGIGKEYFQEIVSKVDLVIHAAADINLLKDYDDLTQVNIASINEIIKLANTGKTKAVHYISSLAVSGYSCDDQCKDFSEDDFDYGQKFVSAYERTKFEGEKLIRAFTEDGGDGKIYRIGHVAADSLNGKFQQNIEQNRIFQLLKGIILLKMIPNTFEEKISFSHVDVVAECISRICMGSIECDMSCIHTENPQYLSFIDISKMLKAMGYKIAVVDVETFREAVATYEGSVKDKKAIDLMANWIQRYFDRPRNVEYNHRRSLDMMALSGLFFPELSFEWFSRMIGMAIKSGYLHPPGIRDWKHQSTFQTKNS